MPSPPTVTPCRKRTVGPEGDGGSHVALWATRTRQWPAADRTLTRRRERRRHSLVCGALPPPSTRRRATRPHPGGHARTVLSGRSARQPRTDADREAGQASRASVAAAASLSAPRWPHTAPPVRGTFPRGHTANARGPGSTPSRQSVRLAQGWRGPGSDAAFCAGREVLLCAVRSGVETDHAKKKKKD